MKKIIAYALYRKSIPNHIKWKLSFAGSGGSEWLTDEMKSQINLIIGEDTPTTQNITKDEANIILAGIAGGEAV